MPAIHCARSTLLCLLWWRWYSVLPEEVVQHAAYFQSEYPYAVRRVFNTPLRRSSTRDRETTATRMVNPGIQVTLRGIVAFSAIFSGGSIVHKVFAPDLTVPDLSKPGGAAPEEGATGFVGAAAFEGARTGFAFKTGSQGLGYYTDKKR